jgi:hypothetical protein
MESLLKPTELVRASLPCSALDTAAPLLLALVQHKCVECRISPFV